MDPIIVSRVAAASGRLGYISWNIVSRIRFGSITITHPQNRAAIIPEWLEIEGVHKNVKGRYWLIANRGNEYWLKCRINILPDGRWKERVNIGAHPGPRTVTMLLVRASTFADSLLDELVSRSRENNNWKSIKLAPSNSQLKVVQANVYEVRAV